MTDKDKLLASLDDLPAYVPNTKPRIEFHRYAGHAREWVCSIHLPDDEIHTGQGTTQCEALMLANIHWAMHGTSK